MEIVVVTSRREAVADFQRYAEAQGCRVRVVTQVPELAAPPALAAPEDTAVVIFDDGERAIADWIVKVREQTRYLSIPVVVAAAHRIRSHSRLLAVGASAICDGNMEGELILKEIRARHSVLPVLAGIRDNLLGPFQEAALLTLRDLASTETTVKAVYQKTGYKMFGDVSAVIGLVCRGEGSMIVSFPEATAEELARRVLAGLSDRPSPDIVRDCVGEIANIIAGQARARLADSPYAFAMTTPTVVSGSGHEIRHKPGMPCLVIAFTSDLGDFALQICIAI